MVIYEELSVEQQDIRLVKLSPSENIKDPLLCDLKKVPLSKAPPFQSLSYAWGQSKAEVPLNVGKGELLITQNLENALRAVRLSDAPILLWCDRICINQQDVLERNHQVQLMRHFYTTASTVNIWLGATFAGAGVAFRFLELLVDGRSVESTVSFGSNPGTLIPNLTAIFKYPWWQRLWVIQEALLARQAIVHCGKHKIQFSSIMRAFENVWNAYILNGQTLRTLCGAEAMEAFIRQMEITVGRLHIVRNFVFVNEVGGNRRYREDTGVWPFLLHTCSWSHVSDPRDKVYGALGLMSSSPVEPDYGLDVIETYTRTTFDLIKRMGNLILVSEAISSLSLQNGLPSWCPDWRHPSTSTAPFLVFHSLFAAGKARSLDVELDHSNMLRLSIAQFDEIVEIGLWYDHQGVTHAADLPSILQPVMSNWMSLASVSTTSNISFLEQFTKKTTPRFLDLATSTPVPPTPQRTNPTIPTRIQTYAMQPQSIQAPLYQDRIYELLESDSEAPSIKRSWTAPAPPPMQSARAPFYSDTDYPSNHASKKMRQNGEFNGTGYRTYDTFSHTYINTNDAAAYTNGNSSISSSAFISNDAGGSEVFWRTLCMDVIDCEQLKKHRRCRSEDSHRLWEWLDWIFQLSQPLTIPQLHWHLNTHLQGKRMVKTRQGYIGLASKDVQVGDKVCLVAGESYPYILRGISEHSPKRFPQFVCPSYMHGWMDGRPGAEDKSVLYESVSIA